MVKLIPEEILKIYKKIKEANFEVYLVGGCVRNMLLKKSVKDWDMTTNATPEQMLKIFPEAFYDSYSYHSIWKDNYRDYDFQNRKRL
jgi:tRNA nucleotidyltransferase/poly(A) polymerase